MYVGTLFFQVLYLLLNLGFGEFCFIGHNKFTSLKIDLIVFIKITILVLNKMGRYELTARSSRGFAR